MPDFLTDGAVRNQGSEEVLTGQSPESEVDRLRQQVELYKQQLCEQVRCSEQFQRQLDIARNKEHEYTKNLTKALEQVEDNLERSKVSFLKTGIVVLHKNIIYILAKDCFCRSCCF